MVDGFYLNDSIDIFAQILQIAASKDKLESQLVIAATFQEDWIKLFLGFVLA